MPPTVDMVVQRRDGPHWLRDDDDDEYNRSRQAIPKYNNSYWPVVLRMPLISDIVNADGGR